MISVTLSSYGLVPQGKETPTTQGRGSRSPPTSGRSARPAATRTSARSSPNFNVCPDVRLSPAHPGERLLHHPPRRRLDRGTRDRPPVHGSPRFPEYPARLKKATDQRRRQRRHPRRVGHDGEDAGQPWRHGLRVHGRLDGLRGRREDRAARPAVAREEVSAHHRLGLGRRAHAGGRALAHADGEDVRRALAARRAAHPVRLDPHEPDDRRRQRELRDARRCHPRRARRGDRFRGPARDQADARARTFPRDSRPRSSSSITAWWTASCTARNSSRRSASCCGT